MQYTQPCHGGGDQVNTDRRRLYRLRAELRLDTQLSAIYDLSLRALSRLLPFRSSMMKRVTDSYASNWWQWSPDRPSDSNPA